VIEWITNLAFYTFWWFVEFFWFALAIYGLPLTAVGVLISRNKEYRSWLGSKKGYAKVLSKLPGVNLRGYRNIRNSTIIYIGLPSLILLIFMLQQYPFTATLFWLYLTKGLVGLVVLYFLIIENFKLRLPYGFKKVSTVEDLKALTSSDFEHLVAAVFRQTGHTVIVTAKSGDGGVDIQIQKGAVKGIVQCKRYQDLVGIKEVRELLGTLFATGADEAYLVTSGRFSDGAYKFVQGKPLTLIDGTKLCKWLK
jgi:hypothetical protein